MTRKFLLFASIALILWLHPALAQDATPPDLPPMDAMLLDDNAPIRMTPDGPAVIRLNEDAASVIVGNPAHASAMLENPRLIMLMPMQPGTTRITALNRDGKAILNRHVLVGGGSSGFIRINRVCGVSAKPDTCRPVSTFYCPDRCYESAQPDSGAPAATSSSSPALPPPAPEQGPVPQ